MTANTNELKREEILALAHEARLMIVDGNVSYMNDMATQKELFNFVRMIEARNAQRRGGSAARLEDVVDFPEFDGRNQEHDGNHTGNKKRQQQDNC